MIPVLAVPILVGPDLLWEMLDTIDHEVGETIIVDNGSCVPDEEVERRGLTVVRPGENLGVGASWNHVIKIRAKARWWAFVGFDMLFAPGELDRLVDHMETTGGLGLLSGFSAFGVDRDAIRSAGLFDENFHPAYFEDNDFDYRCRLAGVPMIGLPSASVHRNSSTLDLSEVARERNPLTFSRNREYFEAKWGGMPYREAFTTPFNGGGRIDDWRLDIDRLNQQRWG